MGMCLFEGDTGRRLFLSSSSIPSLGVIASKGLFVGFHLVEPVNTKPIGHQGQTIKGRVLWAAATKTGVVDVP